MEPGGLPPVPRGARKPQSKGRVAINTQELARVMPRDSQGSESDPLASRGTGEGAPSRERGGSQASAGSLARISQSSLRGLHRGASALGTQMQTDRNRMLRNAQARQQQLERSMAEHESRVQAGSASERDGRRLPAMRTFVRKQVEQRLQGHKPVFTVSVTLVQGLLLAAMMWDGPIADWGLGVSERSDNVTAFHGTLLQEVKRPQNPFYGPVVETLVEWGSKWAPCMREEQIVVDNMQEALDAEADYGCCIDPANAHCGMMSQTSCESYSSTFAGVGVKCANLTQCRATVLRPCCYGIYGQCAIISKDHCASVVGQWVESADVCGEAECLFRMCGMGYDQTEFKASEDNPNQFHRFVTANFLHVGIVHYLMNSMGQYVLVGQVEFVAGFWRTFAMYVISGSCGFMISALLSADQVSNGSSAAIYGMLGVQTVDLFQTWQLLQNKFAEVFSLFVKLVLFLGIGTLPYVDNFAHVGGFLAGIVAGIGFLPFIVFGSIDGTRKYCLQVLAVVALGVAIVGLLYKFYTDGVIVCDWCHYVNCVPYTSGICDFDQEDVKSG